jgi:hypothetical protein
MSDSSRTSKAAQDGADKILVAIYGEDLTGCQISPDEVSAIIQSSINFETKAYRELAEALISAIRQVQVVATPPDKAEVTNADELIEVLGRRADGIREITGKILDAWDKME